MVPTRQHLVGVTGQCQRAHDDAAVLQAVIWVPQPGADSACARLQRQRHHFAQPVRADHFNIVIDQSDQFTAGFTDRTIVQGRIVEWPIVTEHPDILLQFE
ncbi:hypothetical protein D3C78_1731340 [compost metagenome]